MILLHIKLQYFLKWNWKKFEYARNWTRRLSAILAFKFPSASTLGCFDVTWSRYWLLPRIKLATLKTIRGLGRVSFLQRLLGSFPGTRYSAIGQFACHLPSNSPGSPCESQLGTVSLFLKAQFQSCFYWLLRKRIGFFQECDVFCYSSGHFRILSRRVKYHCDLSSIPKRSSNAMFQF